jgi:hypothetical protein
MRAKLDRPELFRLLADSHPGTCCSLRRSSTASRLRIGSVKAQLASRRVRVVALDLPTSWTMAAGKRAACLGLSTACCPICWSRSLAKTSRIARPGESAVGGQVRRPPEEQGPQCAYNERRSPFSPGARSASSRVDIAAGATEWGFPIHSTSHTDTRRFAGISNPAMSSSRRRPCQRASQTESLAEHLHCRAETASPTASVFLCIRYPISKYFIAANVSRLRFARITRCLLGTRYLENISKIADVFDRPEIAYKIFLISFQF